MKAPVVAWRTQSRGPLDARVRTPPRLMLTPTELAALAADLESFRVERKASFKPVKASVEEAICAFANDLPGSGETGVVLIGVDDRSGKPTGLAVTDELLREITDIRSSGNILPLPVMTTYRATLDGADIVVIEVVPSSDTPVRLRGTVRVRSGPRRGIASREEERILTERRRAADLPFDRKPATGATLSDVDMVRFTQEYLPAAVDAETLAENGRTPVEQLASLHLCTLDGVPNHTLMLLYGRDVRSFLPGAYVEFVRFDGVLETDPIVDSKQLNGTVPDVLRSVLQLAELNVRTAIDPTEMPQREQADFPIKALRQLLANSVIHRTYEVHAPVRVHWYTDRVEIESPGGLYGRVREDSFGERGATDYRNPTLAAAMKNLGYVQTFGIGIPLARRECERNGNPAPEFAFGPSHVLATIRAAT